MKKFLLILVIAVLTLCVGVFSACAGKVEKEENISYTMSLSLVDKTLKGEETVVYTNVYAEGLGQTVFHLYPNAYAQDAVNPAYNASLESYGGIEVSSVTVNGSIAEYSLSENKEYLTVKHDALAIGKSAEISMNFVTTIPTGKLRLACGENAYTLSGFYPQLCVYDGDAFRTDNFCVIGDPIYSACADYDVSFECNSNLVVCASCKQEQATTVGQKQTIKYVGTDIRDFAILCNTDYNVVSKSTGNVNVYYFYVNDDEAMETLDIAVNAIKVYGEAFGGYPYDTFSVATAPFVCDGMEYSGLALISDCCLDKETTLLHETAHQWWYGAVGNDSINESYMDEGLATFSAAYYYQLAGNSEKFEKELRAIKRGYLGYEKIQRKRKEGASLAMNKPIYEFTEYQYTMVEYYKACMMFDNIRELYGDEKFLSCLKKYVSDNLFKIGGKDAFIAAAKETLGDMGGLIEGWISDGTVAATFNEEE